IKDNDNELYYRFLNEMNEGMKSGKSILEMKQKLIGYMQSMASSSLPRSSDDSVTAFIQEVINTLQTLNKQDLILCIKNLFPDEYGSLEVGRHLMDYEMIPLLDAINMVIIDGYNNKYSAKIDSDSAEELIYGVLLELGDD